MYLLDGIAIAIGLILYKIGTKILENISVAIFLFNFREAFIRKKRKYIGLLPIREGGSTPRPIYFRFFPEENFYCLKMIYILKNIKKVKTIFFQL